jgi:hypothetical protein
MAKAQFTLLVTGEAEVLAGLGVETPAPVIVKALAMSARAALSAVDREALPDGTAPMKERLTVDLSVRSRSLKVIDPASRS